MEDRITEEALAWHAAQQADDCDWDAFTAWLEADAGHRLAYDEVALLDDKLNRHRDLLARIVPDEAEPLPAAGNRARRWRGFGFVAAAALVGSVSVPMLMSGGGQIAYQAAPGQERVVTLDDGTRVELASASRLTVDKSDHNRLTLEGSAWFEVPHKPGRTLAITAGDYRITDIGTRFEVSGRDGDVHVAVAEGTVSVDAKSFDAPIRLRGGQRLIASQSLGLAELGTIERGDVGSWRKGRLVYQDVPLALVVADISRYAGKRVSVDPAIAGRRFSGVMSIGDGSGLVGNLQQFMGLAADDRGGTVHLRAADDGDASPS